MHAPDDLIAKLLKAWHFLYKRGFIEGFGHISARLPDDPELFLLARHSLGPRANPDDFLVIDMKGRIVSGKGTIPGEYPIHLEILRARPDVGSCRNLWINGRPRRRRSTPSCPARNRTARASVTRGR
jgi:ribulose-5-phosphate 4-epimerase/fuculose-1-phosphate aldolase